MLRAVVVKEGLEEKLKDIAPLVDWEEKSIGSNQSVSSQEEEEESMVLVIRGDLLKRYPNAIIYAVDAVTLVDGADGTVPGLAEYLPDDKAEELRDFPIFKAILKPDTTFLGFPFDEYAARGVDDAGRDVNGGLGKYFVIEERVTEPRFGLDMPKDDVQGPTKWGDLSWSDVGSKLESIFLKLHGVLSRR